MLHLSRGASGNCLCWRELWWFLGSAHTLAKGYYYHLLPLGWACLRLVLPKIGGGKWWEEERSGSGPESWLNHMFVFFLPPCPTAIWVVFLMFGIYKGVGYFSLIWHPSPLDHYCLFCPLAHQCPKVYYVNLQAWLPKVFHLSTIGKIYGSYKWERLRGKIIIITNIYKALTLPTLNSCNLYSNLKKSELLLSPLCRWASWD